MSEWEQAVEKVEQLLQEGAAPSRRSRAEMIVNALSSAPPAGWSVHYGCRIWTAEPHDRFRPRPAEVIWEDRYAEELIALAKHCGYIVGGPYVLEAALSTPPKSS